MINEPPRLVDWVFRLRHLWFGELEGALEAALPGAGEALVAASAKVEPVSGAVHIRMPSVYPVLPPVYDIVTSEIASVLWGAFGNPVAHKVTFGTSAPRRRGAGGLGVYDPGDPSPGHWDELRKSLRDEVLVSSDPAASALLSGVKVRAVALEHVWLEFSTKGARQSLGKLPGAASELNDRLHRWNGGVTAFCFSAIE